MRSSNDRMETLTSPPPAPLEVSSRPGGSELRREPFRRLSDLTPRATEWLWHLRIPRGELTVVEGDPGVNKSSALLDLAARVSTGRDMPDGTPGVLGGVLLMLGEDSIEKTILRRLQAAGADLDRMAIPKRTLNLPKDLAVIQEAACLVDARLLIVDPLMAFLACDSNSDQKVRGALTPLKEFAEKADVSVVMVRHLNKRGGRHALYRGGGSIGIVAATRSALLVGKPPGDPDLRVICQTKSNLGPLAPALCYEPVSGEDGMVRIEWRGDFDCTPEDLLAPTRPDTGRLGEALTFLKEALSGDPIPQQSLKSAAVASGLAWRTVERAKEVLGVTSERKGWGPGSTCLWRLPPEGDQPIAP